MYNNEKFDTIIIGGGHAGCEAAYASARMGNRTLLLTQSIDSIGAMSCNPSIGGIGKSHLAKEVDAMGGLIAQATDFAGIQFRTLNTKKGPAVQALRVQTDRHRYKNAVQRVICKTKNLFIFQDTADDLVIKNHQIQGVLTQLGITFYAPSVVVATGTFLGGTIHIGSKKIQAGRAGDKPANAMAKTLRDLDLPVGRLKTGTPPRIDGHTIDTSRMTYQPPEDPIPTFSCWGYHESRPTQVGCWITDTTEQTHDIIQSNIDLSPRYKALEDSTGPRYCPSIEDKILWYPDRKSHQVFLEPEGLHTNEMYPKGISNSLPWEVQEAFVKTITGLEKAHITRPAYAIEYDFFNPTHLNYNLSVKNIGGLFFAGQINGTTGYEEAAAQGLLAGVNAALYTQEKTPWIPDRKNSYIGVMVDDLIAQGVDEPYRMFTSRAEYRLFLREDNADARLTPQAYKMGLIDEQKWRVFNQKQTQLQQKQKQLQTSWLNPQKDDEKIQKIFGVQLQKETSLWQMLKRPEVDIHMINQWHKQEANPAIDQSITANAKYEGYLKRQIERHDNQNLNTQIPSDLKYEDIKSGLSNELKQKLTQCKPTTLLQANKISGMTPAAIDILAIYIKKHQQRTIGSQS